MLKLGLKLNVENKEVPSLSRLHLSSASPGEVSSFMESLKEVIALRDGKQFLQDDNDTFCFEKASQLDVGSLGDALPAIYTKTTDGFDGADDRDIDFDAVVKHVIVHEKSPPSSGATIHFNHGSYYSDLERYRSQQDSNEAVFGHCILYADVVTSTNTILEKYAQLMLPESSFADHHRNQQLLHRLPTGFTATANVQVAGRGRGSNVWVSPNGSLMFSTVIRHPAKMMSHAPVVFLQYIAAIAIVEGIKSYDEGFPKLPIKLKWPNDICEPHSSPQYAICWRPY